MAEYLAPKLLRCKLIQCLPRSLFAHSATITYIESSAPSSPYSRYMTVNFTKHRQVDLVKRLGIFLKDRKKVSNMVTIAKDLQSRITLNDGKTMPCFGLGMFKSEQTEAIVSEAIKHGYRLIDTAEYYRNEESVGKGVKRSGIQREELFVVTKLWDNGVDVCKSRFQASLKKLDMEYVDLYLIHSPLGGQNVATYKQMMQFQKQGLIKSIGVSNFGVQHLQGLEAAGVPLPVLNQIELHPWQQKRDIVQYCRKKGIAVMGYSPLTKGQNLGDRQLVEIGKRLNKSPAQVLIRWSVQNGFITIPKTSNVQRIAENSDVFAWSIPEEDMKILDNLPQKSCTWNPCESPWEG